MLLKLKKTSLFIASFVAVVLVFSVGCDQSETAVVKGTGGKTVSGSAQLEIDFQSEQKNIKMEVPCSADATVLSVLSHARDSGGLVFESRGEGEMAFVTSIGGVENQRSDGDNWVYRVNGQLGDKSCGVFSVKPGDRVLWVFGKYP